MNWICTTVGVSPFSHEADPPNFTSINCNCNSLLGLDLSVSSPGAGIANFWTWDIYNLSTPSLLCSRSLPSGGGYCESGLDLGCEPVPDWCQVSLSQSPAWLPDPNQRTEGSCPAQNPPTINCYKTSHICTYYKR